jgi:phosphodiesterase/alkaline phosphatase D-like protein
LPIGTATIVNGLLVPAGGPPVALPVAPAPNTVAVNSATVRVILNEQVTAPDGELTVNAVHMQELSGAGVTKDIILGQARCGVDTGRTFPPFVTTDPATSVTSTSAALNVTIDAGGSPTTYKYEYGPTTAFGTIVPASGTLDAGSDVGDVSQPPQAISGLSPGTTYYFRACANNDASGAGTANQVCGDVLAFTTTGTSVPSVSTNAATAIADTSAQVNGTVNAHGAGTVYVFEYGTSTAFGQIGPVPSGNAGSGTASLAVSTSLSGLQPRTTYYYRLVATNSQGTTRGPVQSFTTTGAATAPAVTTTAASNVTQTGALLRGTVNPRGQTTAFTFEYGTTTNFGQITAVDNAGNHNSVVPVSLPVSGLTPNTTYRYRLVATNATGTTAGPVMSFTTAP